MYASGTLRQDRYATRSATQWLSPSLEDLVLAYNQILTECNSITDNPITHASGRLFHTANFQAKSITSAVEKMRQSLEGIGRLLFAQCIEIINPATSNGLPPNLVSCEPSESWLFKSVDILVAALQGELGFLAHPVNHVHTAEMGNQSIHSLAFISVRYTHTAIGVLSQLVAAHLLVVCQALDLRAMHAKLLANLKPLFFDILRTRLGIILSKEDDLGLDTLHKLLWNTLQKQLDSTTNMDSDERFVFIATSMQPHILEHCLGKELIESAQPIINHLQEWRDDCAAFLKREFLENRKNYSLNADATPYLGFASNKMYKFIRVELGIPFIRTEDLAMAEELSGAYNFDSFQKEVVEGQGDVVKAPPTIGGYITQIYEALRNGVLYEPAMQCLKEAFAEAAES